jgi:plasmid maintenance system antidote protein VapI
MDGVSLTAKFKSSLDKWLWENRRTARWVASELGVHEATISRVRNGETDLASDKLLTEIKELTGLKRLK